MSNLSKKEKEKLINILEKLKIEKDIPIKNRTIQKEDIDEIISFINNKKYGLSFENHIEQNENKLEETIELIEKEDKRIETNKNLPYNLLIEGENLNALKLLEKTYTKNGKGLIDIIYIDPPYNTGNNDFKYNDKFINNEDEFKDSKWLSFMQARLEIAYKLLSDTGIIFISIDDNELYNLKLLCDDIFGATNFYGTFIQLKHNTQNDSKTIQRNHEYILCYTKNNNKLLLTYENKIKQKVYEETLLLKTKEINFPQYNELIKTKELEKNTYIETTQNGATGNHNKLYERKNLGYTIYYLEEKIKENNYEKISEIVKSLEQQYKEFDYYIYKEKENLIFKHAIAIEDYDKDKIDENSKEQDIYITQQELIDLGYMQIRPPIRKGNKLGCWTWSLSSFKEYWNKNEILIKKGVKKTKIIKKVVIKEEDITKQDNEKIYFKTNKLPLQSIIDINNSNGTKILKGDNGIIPGCTFNNPKNPEMIKYLIKSYYKKDCIVLDFFAGSGTTGQSVLELNQEDNGNRKFILCTNNENKICEEITYIRLKTIITGLREDGTKYNKGLLANLKYYEIKNMKN